ncbi:MAG: N-acetyltransferase [Marinilabiliales bacterium]|nr:MAG: N-acetyltransferase [Marinilabiliales bacterium]
MIELTEAKIEDRKKAYNWLFHSDFSDFLMNLEGYTRDTIPAYEEFCNEYWDFFFDGTQPENGRCYKVVTSGPEKEEIGFIYYTSFHVKEGIAEIDMWLKSLEYAGRGIGTEAVNLLVEKLHRELGLHTFFMRPSRKNTRAVNAYTKAGFKQTELVAEDYYKPEFIEEYRKGGYGEGNDVFLVKKLK